MSDAHIRIWQPSGGFVDLDAASYQNTDPQASQPVLRQRVEIPGSVTVTGISIGTISLTASPNVTITAWTVVQPITVTGNLSATVNQATVTQGTVPWIVTYSAGIVLVDVENFPALQSVTFSNPTVTILGTVPVTFSAGTQPISGTITADQGTTPWIVSGTETILGLGPAFPLVTVTGFPATQLVTFSNPAITILSQPIQVTYSNGTQVISGTVTADQGTSPWIVSGTDTLLGLGPNFPVVTITGSLNVSASPNVTITNWTYANPITVTGALSVTPTPNVTVTNWTYGLPVTVTGFPAIQPVTFTSPAISGNVGVTQQTTPWTVSTTGIVPVVVTGQPLTVTMTLGTLQVSQTLGTQSVTWTAPAPTLVPVIIDCASSGLNLLTTGSAGVASYVLSYALVASGPVTVQFYDNSATPLSLTGRVTVTTTGGVAIAGGTISSPLFFTGTSRGIQVSLSNAVQVGGHLMVARQ